MLRKIFYSFSLLLLLLSGCKEVSTVSILDEISGVWKPEGEDSLVTLNHAGGKLQFLMNDVWVPVTLGTIDHEQETFNLTATAHRDGKPLLWTLRRVWDKEHKSFTLLMTLHDGGQMGLSFVRKISKEDLVRIANLQATTQEAGLTAAPQAAVPAQPTPTATNEGKTDEGVTGALDPTSPQIDNESFPTKAGIVKMSRDDGRIRGNLILNDKVLLKEVLGADLVARYPIGDQEVIVLSVSTGANGACPVDYYFLTTRDGGQIALSPSISCHHEAEFNTKLVGNKIYGTIDSSEKPDSYEYEYEKNILLENGKVHRD